MVEQCHSFYGSRDIAPQRWDKIAKKASLPLYLYLSNKSKAWVYRAPSEVTRNSLNLELRDCYHRIRRQILLKNAGITFPLAQNLEIQFFGLLGVN